jgi:hypothetical protein
MGFISNVSTIFPNQKGEIDFENEKMADDGYNGRVGCKSYGRLRQQRQQ